MAKGEPGLPLNTMQSNLSVLADTNSATGRCSVPKDCTAHHLAGQRGDAGVCDVLQTNHHVEAAILMQLCKAWVARYYHTLRQAYLAIRHIDMGQDPLISDVCLADQAHPRPCLWYSRRHGDTLHPSGPQISS